MSEAVEGEVPPPENNEETEEVNVSGEHLLNYSQMIRRQLVEQITAQGLPKDEDERKMVLNVLRDMDRTSIDRLKIDVDQQANDNNRQAQEIVEQLYGLNARGLRVAPGEERDHIPEPAPGEIPDVEGAPGETDVGLSQEDVSSFMDRVEGEKGS